MEFGNLDFKYFDLSLDNLQKKISLFLTTEANNNLN